MAKYKGHPYYSVLLNDKTLVRFDQTGYYETNKAQEIAALDVLVPRYFARVDDPVKQAKPKAEPKPKASAK